MANNQIKIGVGFQIDKSGLGELQNSLKQIQIEAAKAGGSNKLTNELKQSAQAAEQLENILNQSWNSKLNQLDLSKVSRSIKDTYGNVQNLKKILEQSGTTGANAYNHIASAILNTNLKIKEGNKLLDEMATSMANTVKWGITSSIFNNITSSIAEAFHYTKRLDSSLNDIRIVTDKSAESMEKFARQANKAAKGLGASTLDYTEASLIYYQQGLNDEDVAARAETTLKAANVTGQYAEEVSEQLTAVWNGYKVSAQEAELYVDKLAAVAASTASDLEELSTGMSKVASAANSMGVDIDQLNAQLATIVSVTRQAPESVGTALKTIYARMSDLKVGGTDEDGLGLGDVSGTMESMGIQVLDASGNLREMGDVIEDVAAKWDTWTDAQKTAMAQVMAGKRQYNNLVALFENWDMYTDALNMSANAAGTLQEQQEIYLESTAAHLQQLRTEAEETYDILFNQDTVNGFADVLTNTLSVFNDFIDGLGGGANAFVYFGSMVARIFNKQIGQGIQTQLENIKLYKKNLESLNLKQSIINLGPVYKENAVKENNQKLQENLIINHQAKGQNYSSKSLELEMQYAQKTLDIQKALNAEEYANFTRQQEEIGIREREIEYLNKYKDVATYILDNEKATVDEFKERLNIEQEELNFQEEQLSKLNREINIYQTYSDLNEKDTQYLFDRLGTLALIADTEEEGLLILQAQEAIANKTQISEEAIPIILRVQNQILDEQKQLVNDIQTGVKGKIAAENGHTKLLQEQQEAAKKLLEEKQKEKEEQLKIQKIITATSTGIQIASSLIGALNTGLNETATGADKANAIFAGTVGSLSAIGDFLFPGSGILIQGIAGIGKGILEITGLWDKFEYSLSSTEEKLAELNGQQEEYINKTKEFENSKKSLEEVVDEYERLSKKAGEYDENIDSLTESERKRYNELKNTVLQYNQDALLGYNAEGEAILKKNQGIQETIDLLKEEYEQKVKNQFVENWEKTTNTRQDIISDANKKVRNIDKKIANIDYDTQNQDYQASLKQQIITQVQNDIGLADADKQKLNTYLKNNSFDEIKKLISQSEAINKDYIIQLIDNLDFTNPDKLKERLEEEKKAAELELEAVKKFDGQLIANTIKYIEDYNTGWTELESLEIKGTDVFLNKFIDSLEYSENFGYDEAYEAADKYAQNLAKVLKSIQEQGLDPEKYLSDLKVNPHDFDTIEEYQQVVKDKIVELLEDPVYDTMSTDEKGQLFTATFGIDIVFNDDTNFEVDAEKYKEKIRDFWNRTRLDGGDLAVVGEGISQTELEKILGPEYIDRLSEIEGLLDKNTIATQGWIVALQNAKTELDKIDAQNAIIGLGDNVDNLTNSFLTGDVTSENIEENADFQAINNQIDELIEKYPELTAAAEVFSQTHLVGTQMWTEALGMLQDKINEVKLDKLKDEYNNVKEEILTDDNGNTIEIKTLLESDTFEDDLDKLLTADYAINVEIHTQTEQAFEQTQSAIENIKEQASKIGDNFIVAADDIRELNNTFPGIMVGMKDLHNGTVQLNQDTVKSAMEAAQGAVMADHNATQEKIKNAIIELKTKQKIYQGMADAATELAKIDVKTDKKAGDYKQKIIEGLSELDKMASDEEMKNDALVATNSNINAGILAENWNNAYQQATQDAITFGQVAAAAAKAAVSGEFDISGIPQDSFKVVYSGNIGENSQEATQIKEQQELVESGEADWAELAASYQNAADSLGKQVTDLEGMAYELGASLGGATNSFKGIATGKGSDNKKDGSKDKKEEKKAQDEIDRYWELNKAIENVEESLSDLDKKQDKLYGRELINSLKQENQLLAQQADRYRALAAEQQREASELQGLLSSYGVVFDAQGGIANYLAATQAMLNQYNQAVAAYNAGLIDEATFGVTERAYENFKSTLDRYEELYYQEMVDTQNKLDDIHRQELENNLQAWEVEIQLKLDMNELERQWDDFFKDINNNFKLLYEDLNAKMSNLMDKTLTYQGGDGDIATIISGIKDVTAEIDKMKSGGESGMFESVSQAQEKLKELNDQLQDSALAMRELWETAWDTYLEGIDQAADKLDDLMDRYDSINEEIEYQRELMELLYGDEAYKLMNQYYDAQEKNTKAEIDSLKLQTDLWKAQYEEALAIDEANGTLSEDTQKFYELWQDAQQGLNDKVIEYIELLQNDYKNTISDIISDLEKSITGGAALDEVKEQWELLKEQSEKYYDDVERIYELSSLASKYENSIINTSNLENQQKLQEMYNKEMKYLENKKFLSEYDLKVANAKYDMTLKQIMLEEAQQNKTSMKLTRGADGNWSYQYVADEDDIASKQQALLDATSQYYQITKDGYHQNLEDMMSAQANYLEKLQEINEKYMNDEEMRAARAQELYEIYYGENGILTLLYMQNEEARTNMADSTLQSILTFYAIDEENYALMTEAEQALIDGLKDGTITNYEEMLDKATQVCEDTLSSWESSAQGIADAWYVDNGYSVKASMLQAYKDLTKANTDYQIAVDILEKSVEQDFGPDGIGGALDSAKNKTEELDNKTAELCDHAESNLARYRQAVNSIGQAWESVKDQIRSAISLVQQYLNVVGAAQSAAMSGLASMSGIGSSGIGSSSGTRGSGSSSGGGSKNNNSNYYYVQTGSSTEGAKYFSVYNSSGQSVVLSKTLDWIQQNYPNATLHGKLFNTGGYTGEWNNGDIDGRLAWLHQKELVLNSSDTENILDAVDTVRSITSLGESINQSIMDKISQMVLSLMNLGNYGKGYNLATAEGGQESVFNINANFPNANDVESIREAIMSLPNLASQYIARNRK